VSTHAARNTASFAKDEPLKSTQLYQQRDAGGLEWFDTPWVSATRTACRALWWLAEVFLATSLFPAVLNSSVAALIGWLPPCRDMSRRCQAWRPLIAALLGVSARAVRILTGWS